MTITMVYLELLWVTWWPTVIPHVRDGGSLQLPPPEVLTVASASFLTPAHVVPVVMDERGGRDLEARHGV